MTDVMKEEQNTTFRAGYIAIVGRPNVGKSTLLNRLLGQKISITSRKPQTTRHRILGIKTTDDYQAVFIDTPGLHIDNKRAMNRMMNKAALSVFDDADVVVFVVAGTRWTDLDNYVMEQVAASGKPVILAVNKVDLLEDKGEMLPHLKILEQKGSFTAIVPISAMRGSNTDSLEACIAAQLPLGDLIYPEDQITDRNERFLAAELIREKLMRKLGAELPYGLAVEIESFLEEDGMYRIHAIVWVDRQGHKPIIIGENGEGLKTVGTQARKDMERLFEKKVFLRTWVKVKEGWAEDERALQSLAKLDSY